MNDSPTLVEDLGMLYPKPGSKQKVRFGVYKCPICSSNYKTRSYSVKNGTSKNCTECKNNRLKKDRHVNKHPLYSTWRGMKRRCSDVKSSRTACHGDRGISVSNEFLDFFVWLKYVESLPNCYTSTYTLDRIDNDGNYERGNLRWASKTTQALNTRTKSTGTSSYKGIHYTTNGNKWVSRISIKGEEVYLGRYSTEAEAVAARIKYIEDNCLTEYTV